MTTPISETVRRVFANRFLKWGIMIRDAVIDSSEIHVINKDDWEIKYVSSINEKGKFYEFYGKHSELHDTHFRIYEDGEVEELEVLTDRYDYNPSIPGDQATQKEVYLENNRRIYESLKAIGLHV
ncbi:MAG: hypothetical protein JXR88_09080 [Clostridia bacterium]|nr:hypothetical protein [Clostridia bacterium]